MKRTLMCAAVALLTIAGCRNEPTELQPAATATAGDEEPVRTPERTAEDAGIRLTAVADGWTGWEEIQREVTPLRVTVRNEGDAPVLVRYASFVVTSDAGRRFAAVPPLQMDQEVETYVAVNEHGPIQDPYWGHDGFAVAPYYRNVYPGFAVYDAYGWPTGYYDTYAGYWADVELPTAEMLERVIPEGVLEPGGYVDGVLFFEHVPEDARGLMLRAELRSPETDQVLARFEIPLVVEEEG